MNFKTVFKTEELLQNVLQKVTQTSTECFEQNSVKGISREQIDVLREVQYVGLQKRLFNFVLWFTTVWSLSVVALLYAKSFNWFGCSLSDWVLCTLLTTTFGTVIGLPLIASSHFFPKKK